MTEIVILLWLADVSRTMTATLIAASSFLALIAFMTFLDVNDNPHIYKELERVKKNCNMMFISAVIMLVVAIILPSRQTLVLLATMKGADMVSKTELGQMAEQVIKKTLNDMMTVQKKGKE